MLSGLILSVSNWPRLTHIGVMDKYLFGPTGLVASVNNGDAEVVHFIEGLIQHDVIGNLLVVAALVCIAMVVQRFAGTLLAKLTSKMQLQLWLGGGLVLLVYAFFSVKYLMPYALLTAQTGVYSIYQTTGWFYILLGYLMMVLALHWFVPFIRLAILHIRIFDNERASLLKSAAQK